MNKGIKQLGTFSLYGVLIFFLFLYTCDKSSSKHPLEPPDDNTQTPGIPVLLASGEYGISGQAYILSWSSLDNAKSYVFQEATKVTFEDSISTTVTDTTLSITKEVQTKQEFYYRIRAVSDTLCSAWSDTVNVVVYPVVMPRPVLRGHEGTIGSGDIYTLTWTNTGDSYTLEEAPTIFFSDAVSYSVNDTLKVLSHTKSEGPVFCYRVKANGVPGVYDSQWSNCISLVVLGKIAFTSDRNGNNEIYIMNEDGTNVRNLSNNPASDTNPSWSPDGTQLVYRTTRDFIQGNLCIMNSDGTNQRTLMNFILFPWSMIPFVSISTPSWSPDGLQIAFSATLDYEMRSEIYVISSDGADMTRLTWHSQGESYPSWSPDGSHIAFVSDEGGGTDMEVYLMDADGSNQRNLSNHQYWDSCPSWSPDGTHIAFQTQRDYNWEIYVMNADGSNQSNLTNHWANDTQPSWSPDGKQIAFTSNRNGNLAIFIMNADGTSQKFLTLGANNDSQPSWCPK